MELYHKELFLKINFSELSIQKTLRCLEKETIGTLIQRLLNLPSINVERKEDYGLQFEDQWLDVNKPIGYYGFSNMRVLELKRQFITVRVKCCFKNPKTLVIRVPSEASIQETIDAIHHHPWYPRSVTDDLSSFGLFLRQWPNLVGLRMDSKRTMASYRLKPSDLIEYKYLPNDPIIDSRNSFLRIPNICFVQISSSAHGIVKTLQTTKATTIQQLLALFISKNPIDKNIPCGFIYYGPQRESGKKYDFLDETKTLDDYKIPNMAVLHFKARKRPSKATESVKPTSKVFGVDPKTLPQVVDDGFTVPSVVVTIKKALLDIRGLETEGIFRLAGSENSIKRVKLELNLGTFKSCTEEHCLASILKKWFGELPVRLFNFTPQQLNAGAQDIQQAKALVETLPSPQKELVWWLTNFTVMTAQLEEKNKMTPVNLSIVWGPALVTMADLSDPLMALQITKDATEFFLKLIMDKLNEKVGTPIQEEVFDMADYYYGMDIEEEQEYPNGDNDIPQEPPKLPVKSSSPPIKSNKPVQFSLSQTELKPNNQTISKPVFPPRDYSNSSPTLKQLTIDSNENLNPLSNPALNPKLNSNVKPLYSKIPVIKKLEPSNSNNIESPAPSSKPESSNSNKPEVPVFKPQPPNFSNKPQAPTFNKKPEPSNLNQPLTFNKKPELSNLNNKSQSPAFNKKLERWNSNNLNPLNSSNSELQRGNTQQDRDKQNNAEQLPNQEQYYGKIPRLTNQKKN